MAAAPAASESSSSAAIRARSCSVAGRSQAASPMTYVRSMLCPTIPAMFTPKPPSFSAAERYSP